MNTGGFRAQEARRKAQERFEADRLRAAQAVKERESAAEAIAAKTRRLRALRLAKEASDREAAQRLAAIKAAAPARSKKAASRA